MYAAKLCEKIMCFLIQCGGPYEDVTGDFQRLLLDALARRQFVMKSVDGDIRWFAAYWRVTQKDLTNLAEHSQPVDVSNGEVLYVTEMGNKDGKEGMKELVAALVQRNPGIKVAAWHRGKVFKQFKLQKGVHDGV